MKKIAIFFVLLLTLSLFAANEIRFAYDSSDDPNLYVIIGRTTDANVWDVDNTAWADWTDADEPNYALDMSEVRKDFYDAQFPTDISTAGTYPLAVYLRASTDPNITDDLIVGDGELFWDGSAEITDAVIDTVVDAIFEDTNAGAAGPWTSDINEADIGGAVDDYSSNIDTIIADSNEMQTDWADGGRLDLLLDAVLADSNDMQEDWATTIGYISDLWLSSGGGGFN